MEEVFKNDGYKKLQWDRLLFNESIVNALVAGQDGHGLGVQKVFPARPQ